MAYEADRVVVSLVADNSNFDSNVRSSATAYQQSMGAIETAAGGAEKAHGRMTLAANNNRIAMLELQHVVRGSADQFAAGAPVTQIFAQHIASIGEAAALAGSGLGKIGAFLSGPWGLALTAATALVVTLISKHKEEAETLDDLIEKRKEHAEKTALSAQADDIWKHSIDGVIESEKALADAIEHRLTIQSVADRQTLATAQETLSQRSNQLDAAESQFNEGDPRLTKAREAYHQALRDVNALQELVAQGEGEALADLTKRSQEWAETTENNLRYIRGIHPELAAFATEMNAAFDQMKKAVSNASAAGINVGPVIGQFDSLNDRLKESPAFINEYIRDVKNLASQIDDFTTKAKNAPKAIDDFKKAVIGAEGLGHNPNSSAYGFGQFLAQKPGEGMTEWQSYFRQLYPRQASGMTTAAIDAARTDKDVATAIISAATDDYVKVLKAAGQQITEAGLYTVHMLGAGGARRFFAASPDASAASVVGSGVAARNGNIFTGTVADARAEIARRIGDSSAVVSTGAAAIQRVLDDQTEAWAKLGQKVAEEADKEQEVTVAKERQVSFIQEYNGDHSKTLEMLVQTLADMRDWNREYELLIASEKELKDIGGQLVDDVLNPDNWRSWGDLGKTILHDLKAEFIKLAAINPLKNLINGSSASPLPTLGGIFTNLFGGAGSSSSFQGMSFSDMLSGIQGLGARAGGGPVSSGQAYLVGEKGPEVFVPSGSGTIIPNNEAAAAPYSGSNAGGGNIYIHVDAKDAVLARTVQQWIAAGMTQAASGGSVLARRNLGREAQHRLE